MPIFQTADNEVVDLVKTVMKQHHQRLIDIGVSIHVLMAFGRRDKKGRLKGPALKHRGQPVLAMIEITSHKDRVAGLADCILTIDGDRWPDLPDGRQPSLIDHELTHLVTPMEHGGELEDDCGRPILKMREHDFELTGFWDVIDRHKDAANESDYYKTVHKGFTQRCFPWG